MAKRKITAEYCPKCKDKKMVMLESGEVEVFECENQKKPLGLFTGFLGCSEIRTSGRISDTVNL